LRAITCVLSDKHLDLFIHSGGAFSSSFGRAFHVTSSARVSSETPVHAEGFRFLLDGGLSFIGSDFTDLLHSALVN